jgi:hypothetical protein
VEVLGMKCTPYLINFFVYPINISFVKNGEKNRYDITMNSRKVGIESTFGTLKNRWWILKTL